jgi:hypothetical protein
MTLAVRPLLPPPLQGIYARRHVATNPRTARPYAPTDFAVGESVTIYGRPFTLCDADERTRRLLRFRFGIELGPGMAPPGVVGGPASVPPHAPRTNTVAFDVGREEDPERGCVRSSVCLCADAVGGAFCPGGRQVCACVQGRGGVLCAGIAEATTSGALILQL